MEDFKEERWVSVERINEIFAGKIITNISGLKLESDGVTFHFEEEEFYMSHEQDCCESVYVEDINGDTNLAGATFYEIIDAKRCDREALTENEESHIWTFYTIKTSKGYLDIRWYGASNGYYSEQVDFSIKYLENKGVK